MNILNQVDQDLSELNFSSFPHSVIVCGLSGSGRKTLIQKICSMLNIEYEFVLDKSIDLEFVNNLYLSTNVRGLVFDTQKLSEKDQNELLKITEEPPENIFLFFITENINFVIPTIKNRCIIYNIKPYSENQLKEFCEDSFWLSICRTPGQIYKYSKLDKSLVEQALEISQKLIKYSGTASVPNLLSILDKINWEDWDDNVPSNIPIELMSRIIISTFYDYSCSHFDFFPCYIIAKDFNYHLSFPRIDKRKLMEKFLLDIRKWVRRNGYKAV